MDFKRLTSDDSAVNTRAVVIASATGSLPELLKTQFQNHYKETLCFEGVYDTDTPDDSYSSSFISTVKAELEEKTCETAEIFIDGVPEPIGPKKPTLEIHAYCAGVIMLEETLIRDLKDTYTVELHLYDPPHMNADCSHIEFLKGITNQLREVIIAATPPTETGLNLSFFDNIIRDIDSEAPKIENLAALLKHIESDIEANIDRSTHPEAYKVATTYLANLRMQTEKRITTDFVQALIDTSNKAFIYCSTQYKNVEASDADALRGCKFNRNKTDHPSLMGKLKPASATATAPSPSRRTPSPLPPSGSQHMSSLFRVFAPRHGAEPTATGKEASDDGSSARPKTAESMDGSSGHLTDLFEPPKVPVSPSGAVSYASGMNRFPA